jgi:hypothetical protein
MPWLPMRVRQYSVPKRYRAPRDCEATFKSAGALYRTPRGLNQVQVSAAYNREANP